MNSDYLFIIYSCRKYTEKSEFLYKLIHNKIKFAKCYIVYGDETLNTNYKIDNKYIVLKCRDDYEHLSCKTIMLFNTIAREFPNMKGVFKCDDDILPNKQKLNELYEYIEKKNPSYLGGMNTFEKESYVYNLSLIRHNNRSFHLRKSCTYASGPLYYLNMETILILNKNPIIKDILKNPTDCFFEDNMVGYLLSKENINPIFYVTYYNDVHRFFNASVQNVDNKIKNLFIKLHGGLGNQLFQVSFAYVLAKKHNMHIVLVYDEMYRNMTHNTSLDEFLSTIFYSFNSIAMTDINYSKVMIYYEDKCFSYKDNIIQHNSDYLIEGYFQNKKYLKDCKTEVVELFQNPIINSKLKISFPFLNDSYFIHIRRGDYVKIPIYHYDMDSYFSSAIQYIIDKKEPNIHFYIFSDDISFCKNYHILNKISNKTFIENMTTLDSLYLMSLCHKGGICSNSTFSGWASTLNTNPEKICIVPKNWINIDYPYEIPFEYTIAL